MERKRVGDISHYTHIAPGFYGQSVNEHLLSTYYVPSTVLSAGDTKCGKIVPILKELTIQSLCRKSGNSFSSPSPISFFLYFFFTPFLPPFLSIPPPFLNSHSLSFPYPPLPFLSLSSTPPPCLSHSSFPI